MNSFSRKRRQYCRPYMYMTCATYLFQLYFLTTQDELTKSSQILLYFMCLNSGKNKITFCRRNHSLTVTEVPNFKSAI